jgi:cytochrome c2
MLITKLDFAFMHDEINHTKWDWFRLKLDNPRMYDMIPQGDDTYTMRVKRPLEKLRMPHFGLNEKELDAIVTVIMGFVKDEIPPTKLPPKTTSNLIVEEGQRLLQTYNCKGCHSIDGEGGAIIPTVASWLGEISDETSAEDASLVQSFAPPLLNTEGRKVQPEWLFNFMKKPTMIRPNLQVRMPTYNMITDNELNKIIKYFQYKDNQMLAYEKPHTINKNSDSYKAGEVIQELGACNNCHFYGKQKPKQAALTWAPNLALAKDRFRQDWLLEFFANPQDVMSGTKMPAPYIPTDEPQADVLANWGKSVANMNGDSTKLYQGLIDYIWGIKGQHDISKIVKKHLESEDYGFIIEDEEDDWGDDDW